MASPNKSPSSNSQSSKIPVKEFANILSEENDWYKLGVHLGVPVNDLKHIEHHYGSKGTFRCLVEVYEFLDKMGAVVSEKTLCWERVCAVLRDMKNHTLADEIYTEYICTSFARDRGSSANSSRSSHSSSSLSYSRHSSTDRKSWHRHDSHHPHNSRRHRPRDSRRHHSDSRHRPHRNSRHRPSHSHVYRSLHSRSSTPIQQRPLPTSSRLSNPLPKIVIKDDSIKGLADMFESLRDEFLFILFQIKALFILMMKGDKGGDNLRDVVDQMNYHGLERLPEGQTTVDAVFDRLEEHCGSMLNIKILWFIAKNFLTKNEELLKIMTKFKESVNNFKLSVSMVDLVALIKQKQPKIVAEGDYRKVELKVQEFWSKLTMKRFEIMINEIFETLHGFLHHISVTKGCICISWIISRDVNYTKLLPQLPVDLVRSIGVISLHIGDEVIYNIEGDGYETIEAAMIQAVKLQNTRAVELLIAVGCRPEVAANNGENTVTTIINIKNKECPPSKSETSIHVHAPHAVYVLGHDDHVEAILDPNSEPQKCTETSHFLRNIIDQSENENFTSVPDYTKALQERQSVLDEAMAEGGGDFFQCNIVFHGPPGAGKSSVKVVILGKPPHPKHKQTATDIVENCVRAVKVDRVAATSNEEFKEVDNEEIIRRITAQVEKYRKQKKSAKAQDQPFNSSSAEKNHETALPDEETTSDSGIVESYGGRIMGSPSGDRPSSITETLELIRTNFLNFSSSYKPVFDSHWLHHIDSGGQPQFLDVFPLMYRSPNSHFVVVMRLTDGLDERPKVRFYIEGNDEYCLPDHLVLSNREMIIRMCQVAQRISRSTGGRFKPRVFVVGTHIDQIRSNYLKELNEQFAPIYKMYNDVLVCKSNDEFIFAMNAMTVGKERQQYTEELQKHILLATENTANPITIPLLWLILHLELEKCADVIRMEKCLELAVKIGIEKERVPTALEFLNKAALVLYYPDDVPDLVIIKMDPFTSRLSKLIKASFIAPDKGPTKESDELRKTGTFKKSFLQRVFHDVADNLISDEEFLKLLESLKIAVYIGGDEYFLPSVLSLEPPSGGRTFDSINSNPLALLWDELILPHGFFLTVSVELQDKTGEEKEGHVFELRRDITQWRGAIQFNEAKGRIPGIVMLTDRQRWIEVAYSGDRSYCPIVYQAVSSATHRAVERLRHTGIDSPTVGLTCPLCKENDHYCTITMDREFVTCSINKAVTGEVTEAISCWFKDEDSRNSRSSQLSNCDANQQPKLGVGINLTDVLDSVIDVTYDWSSLGLALGLPDHEIERIRRADYSEKDRLTRMVSMWLESGTNTSWEGLVEALRRPSVDERALASRIAEKYLQ